MVHASMAAHRQVSIPQQGLAVAVIGPPGGRDSCQSQSEVDGRDRSSDGSPAGGCAQDKTGGVLVQRAGGVLYVYRGRNYNYNLRPRFPLMLWKPHAPIYPRLIDDAPPGLSLLEANLMRHAGRKLKPFTRIGMRIREGNQVFECCSSVWNERRRAFPHHYREKWAHLWRWVELKGHISPSLQRKTASTSN